MPIDVFSLGTDVTRKILCILLVAMSQRHAHWYYSFANASKQTQEIVDSLLQDPDVLEQLTFWDRGTTRKERKMLERITERGLKKVKTIKIIATEKWDDYGHKATLLSCLSSLEHLDIRGTSGDELFRYLGYFQEQRLGHLTTDCLVDCRDAHKIRWPMKVTLLDASLSFDDILLVAATAYVRGMDELELAPVQLFEEAQAYDSRGFSSVAMEVVLMRRYDAGSDEVHRAVELRRSWSAGKLPFAVRLAVQ